MILVELSDTDKTLADPSDDIRGHTVHDSDGTDVGTVADLLVDRDECQVRFLKVEHGGILGFGTTPSFIPVEAVARVEADTVHLGQSAARIGGAPPYDPQLTDRPDADPLDYYRSLYGYYGFTPFWGGFPTPPPRV